MSNDCANELRRSESTSFTASEICDEGTRGMTDRTFPSRLHERPSDAPKENERSFRKLTDVIAETLDWVWEGLIPRGKMTLITGEPGVCKSLLTLQVAAMVTRGLRSPQRPEQLDQSSNDSRSSLQPGAVVLISADDEPADTIHPRLEAAGADVSNVYILCDDRPTDDATNETGRTTRCRGLAKSSPANRTLPMLEEDLLRFHDAGIDVRLIAIDPIDGYLDTLGKGVGLTSVVGRLTELATELGAAVSIVANSTSSRIGRTGYRCDTIGHEEFANGARSVLTIVQDLEFANRRLVLPVKTNLCENW